MHIQWQLAGQTLGQESRLTTSVMVNLMPRPSCTQRKTIIQVITEKTALEKLFYHLRPDKGQASRSLTGLASFLHLLSEGVEKA